MLKADVQGSLEASSPVPGTAWSMKTPRCGCCTPPSGQSPSPTCCSPVPPRGIIISFSVGSEPSAERLADRMGVEIRPYNIIYQLIDDVELALHGMLEPVYNEVIVGRAEIREIFDGRRGHTDRRLPGH